MATSLLQRLFVFTHALVEECLFMMIPKTLALLLVGAGIGVTLVSVASPAIAQLSNSASVLGDVNQQNKDPFSNPSGSNSSVNGIFDLIHRAALGSGKSSEEFDAEQSESLDAATEAFRAQQKAQLNRPQSGESVPQPPIPQPK
jgi:hypothetical protein